ncbi:DUF2971 domain-containing protein [Pseudomonas sp. Irchel s3h17]|uniref:DUF2971 domain-containing protein n=1 Tax=Pseudomonas sp. Irchel s3h17 TaxID=2009182 RepID=UPI000BA3113C|nr:DUF2971 domain-containing protein [Pseudomonas sp. Irchel s3h17]
MTEELEGQLNTARNIFFGVLKGIDASVKIKLPTHVYHYTSWDSFCSMIETNSVRLHTTSNFTDSLERKHIFSIENRISGTITDKETGENHDLAAIINNELSSHHVFIQSNTTSDKNAYLWRNYGDQGKGICLCFSTKQYLDLLNETLTDFELLPDYLKCCYVSYNNEWADRFMEMIFPAIQQANAQLGNAGYLVWFFFLEYWRNFIKVSDPYEAESEVRFVVSDNYSIFLQMCSLLAKWGHFTTCQPIELSEAFNKQYIERKNQIHTKLSLSENNKSKFVSIPLDKILHSVTIGPNASFTKSEISIQTNGKIKKSRINKSFVML